MNNISNDLKEVNTKIAIIKQVHLQTEEEIEEDIFGGFKQNVGPKFKQLSSVKKEEVSVNTAPIKKTQIENEKKVAKNLVDLMLTTRGKKDSLAPIYSKHISLNENISVSLKGDNLCFYEWLGNTWKAKSTKEGRADALEWIEKVSYREATATNAISCYESSMLSLLTKRKLPEAPKAIIIPLKDRWLEVSEDGEIKNIAPNKKYGITHLINANVGSTEEIFIPKELAEDSLFFKFLNSCLPDKEEQSVLQEYIGYTFLRDTRYQKALVLEGGGGNGKGAMTEIITALHKNVASIRLDKIGNFGLAQLPDASLVVVNEVPKQGIDEEMFKQLIAGDNVVIEKKGQDQFTDKPFAKWIISCNAFPKITDESKGVWRRIILIKFNQNFEESKEKDVMVATNIIENEMFNVVQWALIGLKRLLGRGHNAGFVIPQSMKNNIIDEQANSNNVLPFIEENYLFACLEYLSSKEEIYLRYRLHCQENGINPYGVVQFWKRINQKFPNIKTSYKPVGNQKKGFVNLVFDYRYENNENPFREG